MKTPSFVFAAIVVFATITASFAGDEKEAKFGDTKFVVYEGEQSWPTGESAQINNDFSIPIYIGLPTKKYKVLGRIYDERKSGVGVVGKAFAEGLFSEKDRQRDCANQARFRGADAVLVTSNEKIIKALGVSNEDVHDTAPLFDHKDKVVVAIKFN